MTVSQELHNIITQLETLFNVNMESGGLVTQWDNLMGLLVSNTELSIDDEKVPIVYYYTFVMQWGEEDEVFTLQDKEFDVYDLDSLYDYLTYKYYYDKGRLQDETTVSN